MSLIDYRKKIYSQFGEEGIVDHIWDKITPTGKLDNYCVEMGAGDGLHESNTKYFIEEEEWAGLMIEGDTTKGSQIKNNTPRANVLLRNVQVGELDSILKNREFPLGYDFLSLDVDGDEWHHLRAMTYRPRIICVEINPSIDFRTNFVQQQGAGLGCSTLAMFLLAKTFDYSCVLYDMPNMFLVDNGEIGVSGCLHVPSYIDLIAEGEQGRLEVFSSYSSEVYVSGFDFWGARHVQLLEPKGHIFEQWPLKKVMAL